MLPTVAKSQSSFRPEIVEVTKSDADKITWTGPVFTVTAFPLKKEEAKKLAKQAADDQDAA